MHLSTLSPLLLTLSLSTLTSAQTLTIPTRTGTKLALSSAITIPAGVSRDYNNQEFDRGRSCNLDVEYPAPEAVFILEDGAKLSNVIIGVNQREGVVCKGACTLENVWWRAVCNEAVSLTGSGKVLIQGGGVASAADRVVLHKGSGTVTIKDFTAISTRNLFSSCGSCTNNSVSNSRHVIITNLKANKITSGIASINSNYGDTATVSGSCGQAVNNVCQEFKGVNVKTSEAVKVSTKANCLGAQGKLASLPAC